MAAVLAKGSKGRRFLYSTRGWRSLLTVSARVPFTAKPYPDEPSISARERYPQACDTLPQISAVVKQAASDVMAQCTRNRFLSASCQAAIRSSGLLSKGYHRPSVVNGGRIS
jgi:hypothetical protein